MIKGGFTCLNMSLMRKRAVTPPTGSNGNPNSFKKPLCFPLAVSQPKTHPLPKPWWMA
jgi:hypothetical protein